MLGDVLLPGLEPFGELVHAQLAVPKQVEDPDAHRLPDGAEAAGDQVGEVLGQGMWEGHRVYPT